MEYRDNRKWWNHILIAKGRASRLEFNLILLCIVLPLVYWMYQIVVERQHFSENFLIWLLIYVVVALYIGICAMIRRNHDMGNSGISRKTVSGWEFLFRKGDPGMNKYGSNPCRDYENQINELNEI